TVEVISYVKVAADNSRMTAVGPGFNGEPSAAASIPNYQPLSQIPLQSAPLQSAPLQSAPLQSAPLPQSAELPSLPTPRSTILDDDAIESGEPYYRDLVTGERITLPEGVKPIPYVPDAGPGSLGAGGAPLPPGTAIGDGAYNIDPLTGEMVPVSYQGQ
ncbi:MAG: hypothetical protein L3J05_05515, partial [Robiginitomaculum sp.]|nr:hypothetical protein [Robiginitomaculum sp.]